MTNEVVVNLKLWEQILIVIGIAISKDPELIGEIINIEDLHNLTLKEKSKDE